ncbi:MAG: hypothetical protein WC843_02820 [Candidatus Gracilibacteria bacterium]|jgi:hypothetical protein
MPNKRINQIVSELSFEKKLIGAGSLLMILSLFLPWYSDLDTFHYGQTFIGINGPLYLIGLTFLAMAGMTLALIIANHLRVKIPFESLKSPKLYLSFGIFSFYLLFVTNSIYFDKNFGVNLTDKNPGYGMFIAFLAASSLTIGGYLNTREKTHAIKAFEEETRDPIMAAVQQKSRESLRSVRPETNSVRPEMASIKPEISSTQTEARIQQETRIHQDTKQNRPEFRTVHPEMRTAYPTPKPNPALRETPDEQKQTVSIAADSAENTVGAAENAARATVGSAVAAAGTNTGNAPQPQAYRMDL